MKRLSWVSFTLLAAVGAQAQSLSSFQLVSGFSGLTASISGSALTVNTTAAPTFVYLSSTYTVTEVFGVWALDQDGDMAATGAVQNLFGYDDNYAGAGGIAGWKTNPNSGWVGSSKVFNFSSLTGTVEGVGMHVRVAETLSTGGNTLYVRNIPVPEPMTLSALGLGAVALIRRRKRA